MFVLICKSQNFGHSTVTRINTRNNFFNLLLRFEIIIKHTRISESNVQVPTSMKQVQNISLRLCCHSGCLREHNLSIVRLQTLCLNEKKKKQKHHHIRSDVSVRSATVASHSPCTRLYVPSAVHRTGVPKNFI